MNKLDLQHILALHYAWIKNIQPQEQADLFRANLSEADLSGANLSRAKLSGADLSGANIDFSSWPLHCCSLKVILDDKIKAQLLYHVISVSDISFFTSEQINFANTFHRVLFGDCKPLGGNSE